MLHEFKRPMWNDGYSKEQPWLNYFNSYERMHCCFEGDADDSGADGSSDDDIRGGGTGSGTTGSTPEGGPGSGSGTGSGTGVSGTGVEEGTDRDADDQEDISGGTGSGTGGTGGGTGGTGGGTDGADIFDDRDATYNAATNSFDFAVDKGAGNFAADVASIGFENFENPGDLDLATMNEMYNNPDAYGMGYNDFVDMGYFDKAEAADYAKSKAEAAALEASYKAKGKDVNISVAKDGTYSYTGKDAGTVGLSEMGKGLSYAMASTGIGGLVSGIARTLGITEEEVTAQDISMVTGGQNYGGLREEGITSDQVEASYGGSGTGLASDFDAMQQQADADLNDIISAYEDAEIGRSDTQLDRDISAYEDAEGAMFGGNYAGQQNEDETFGEDETDEGVDDTDTETSTTESEEEEEAPETAMEAYFRKLGIASPAPPAPPAGPVAPSSFQQYSSYLPPIGPAANAAYRRKLALGTPIYQEPSGPNPSISTLAAVYGLTYEKAAEKFAFPSVPAASGGGLNSLMRYK